MTRIPVGSFFIALLVLVGCANDMNGILASPTTGDLLDPPAQRVDVFAEIRAQCGEWVEPGGDVKRWPYVQSVTHESARVVWTTSAENAERLELWQQEGDEPSVAEPALDDTRYLRDARQLSVPLLGLEPDRIYCYRLRTRDGDVVYGPTGFRTAPRRGEGTARIVVFGDSGGANADQVAVGEQLGTVAMDAVLHTGDLAYEDGTLGQLEAKHFAMYGQLMASVPFFPSIGDHDHATGSAGPYLEAFALPDRASGSERWYSFDWGPAHVVVLDSNVDLDPQRTFLRRDLAENAHAPWTIVVISTPLYSSGFHGGDRSLRDAFQRLFIDGGVDLVVSGDDHDYERTSPIEGVTYVVTGGGGRSVRSVGKSWFTAFSTTAFHFVSIVADRERLRLHAIDGTGREFDGVELTRR
ncbi:metallophosphoesterase [Sandaracinus amylolyticus]|uniref:metallophosphoesterase n=1 Tax=Sandaracinus amylolyticus TaxID=927083 RepID=UPI001F311661|nr:metallophosphoesterase [Sandaracinus amylolyticus]UJR85379.1 Hypothetical protein I5071_74590 [Sandaracinus amylolyticus]